RLASGDAGLEAPDDNKPVILAGWAVGKARWNRRPQIALAIGKQKRRRHYANDRIKMAVEAKRFPDHTGIGVKATAPKAIADHHGGGSVEGFFLGGEFAAERRRHGPDLKKPRRDPGVGHFFWQRPGGFGNVLGVIAGEALEGGVEAIPVFE